MRRLTLATIVFAPLTLITGYFVRICLPFVKLQRYEHFLVGNELRRLPSDPHLFRYVCLDYRYPECGGLPDALHVARHSQAHPQTQQDGGGPPDREFL